MRRQQLINKLIEADRKTAQLSLIRKNPDLICLELARELKNTYYGSWTTAPQKTRNAARALKLLKDFLPFPEVTALASWVSGIANLTDGEMEKAIVSLNRAASIFSKIGLGHDAAQTKVAKLIALALLGKYDEALRTGRQALVIFGKYRDELAAGKVEKNLGNIMARRGNETTAERYYLAARRRFAKLKNKSELAMCDNSLANTYGELNAFRKAEIYYSKALASAQQAGMSVTEAEIEASMGNLALFRGKLDEALRFLELSRQKFEALEMPHQTAIAELEMADIYLEINLIDEALPIYKNVSDSLKRLKLRGEEARARSNFGRAAMAKNQPRIARVELSRAYKLYRAEKNPAGAANVKLTQVDLEIGRKNYEAALRLVAEAKTLLKRTANPRPKIMAQWLNGEILRHLNKTKAAQNILTAALSQAERFEQSGLAQMCLVSLGRAALQVGDKKAAEKYLTKAVRLIETIREPLAAEDFRMAFLANKLAPFEGLAKLYLENGDLKNAFLTIEKAKSRALSETLDAAAAKKRKPATKLDKELANLREELNWFYSRLNRAEATEVEDIWKEVNRRESAITSLLRRIESVRSSTVKRANTNSGIPKRNLLDELQGKLGPQRALIEFVSIEGRISALVVTEKRVELTADIATEPQIRVLLEGFQFQLDALRYGTDHLRPFLSGLKKRADHYLQELYTKLLAPLKHLTNAVDLIVVPTGVLHYVPFHALYDGNKYLVEQRGIAYAPSAAVWAKLQQRPSQQIRRPLLMAYADERIPLVEKEVAAVRRVLNDARSFVGKKATFEAFSGSASGAGLIHLACHGQFRSDRPMFSSLHLADGWVTVRDLVAKRISAELVTLSACETGISEVFAGEELLGLTRGFLSAGARAMVVSLWAVNDKAATKMMPLLYKKIIAGVSPPEALRQMQLDAVWRGQHPALWGAFVYLGP